MQARDPRGRFKRDTGTAATLPALALSGAGLIMLASLIASTSVGASPPAPVELPIEAPTPLAIQRLVALSATPAPEPPVTAIESPLEPIPQELTVLAPMRLVTAQPVPITTGEFYEALARSDWPTYLWDRLLQIARCESTMNLNAEGDGGRAIGLLQIRVDAHREKSVRYDLRSLDEQLAAAWLVFREAHGFGPWSCA